MALDAVGLQQPLRYTVDLKDGLVQQPMSSQLMKGDKKANRVIVRITNGSETVDLAGVGVSGSFIRPPDEAELTLAGNANGNEAVIVLDDLCYAEEGYCEIDVKLTVNGVSRTVLALTGYVLAKGNGAYIDVGNVIPNVDDIIAQYAEMKAVTERTLAAAQRAEALAINASGYAANTGMLGGRPPSHYSTAEQAIQLSQQIAENAQYTNLAENSDFEHWVAQAGIMGSHGLVTYGGDRWILTTGSVSGTANSDGDGYRNIKLNGTLVQVVETPPATATPFVEMVSGTATISYNASKGEIILTSSGGVIKNVLLIPGVVTKKPVYISKGYAAELQSCQRHFLGSSKSSAWQVVTCTHQGYVMLCIPTPATMRKSPVVVPNSNGFEIYVGSWIKVDITAFGVYYSPNCVYLQIKNSNQYISELALTVGMSYLANFLPALSADIARR